MLKRIKVRGKLLLLIVTPLLAVLVFAFSGATDRSESASFQEREARIAQFADAGSDLSLAIQVERLRTIQADAGGLTMDADENPLAAEQAASNEALDRWLVTAEAARGDLDDVDLLAELDLMTERLPANLSPDRGTDGQLPALVSFLALASRSVDEITAGLVDEAADLELFQALSDHNQLQAIQSAYADVTSVGADALTTGDLPIVSATLLEAAERRISANIEAFNATADPERVAALADLQNTGVLPSPASAASHPVEEVRSFLDNPDKGGFIQWVIQGEERLIALNGLIDSLLADATSAAIAEADAANQEAQSFLILAGSVVLLALVMALLIGRSISRPLIRLTRNAEQLSTEELPALVESMKSAGRTETPVLTPIEVKGRDEVAQLASAISEIQQVTIDVAEEQGDLLRRGISDIFVNLARRNQSLLDRQIDFIDQLEAREENPDQLENLFRLDHLATRMRRNAESLLVLAGAEPTRRRGRPVEIADVMRVAMGEIEDFSRIHLIAVDAATVAGSVAVDLAHLMSELMENATQFSPPEADVDVVGALSDNGGYRITLTDKGIGMSAEQIATANETLAEPPIVGLDLSRSLGFTVVSRLANRLGVRVELSTGSHGGVTATVSVPGEMVGTSTGDDLVAESEDDTAHEGFAPEVMADPEDSVLAELAPEGERPGHPIEPVPAAEFDSPTPADAGPPTLPTRTPTTPAADGPATLPTRSPTTPAADGPATLPTRTPTTPAADGPATLPTRTPTTPTSSEPPILPTRTPSTSPFTGEPGAGSPFDPPAPAAADAGSDDIAGLPVRDPVGADTPPKLPSRKPAAAEPAAAEKPASGDLFAAFGAPTDAPAPPADPDQDLFAPIAPAPGDPAPPEPDSTLPPSAEPPTPVGAATDALPTRSRGGSIAEPVPAGGPAGPGAADPADNVTSAGLIRRTPRKVEVPEESKYSPGQTPPGAPDQTMAAPTANRSPEEVRQMLSRYRSGLRKGRTSDDDENNPDRGS